MSLPTVTDVPIPVFTPPVRRGWPRTAWCVIALAVLSIVLAHLFLHPKEVPSAKADPDPIQMMSLRFVGKYLVGGYNLSGRSDPQYAKFTASMDSGAPEQRLDIVILAGELSGPDAARKQLDQLRMDWNGDGSDPTPEQRQVSQILDRMYEDYDEERFDSPSLSPEDREQIRKELGWFGDLALTPPAAPGGERQAVLAPAYKTLWATLGIVAASFMFLSIGFLGLLVFFVLAFTHFLRGGLQRGSLHGGIYAETFALWLFLFFAIGIGLRFGMQWVSVGESQLFLMGLGNLLSLTVLAWPVMRGIPWAQVRKDVGLTRGRAGFAEPLVGLWTFIMSLPLVLIGMLIVLFLLYAMRNFLGGDSPSGPSHPIQEFVTMSNGWMWLQMVFVASIVAPVVEEIMFRGVLYRQMRQVTSRWGFVPSLLLSMFVVSLVFAVIHPQGLLAVPALMAIAFGLNLTREWRVSLLPSMVQHGLHNGCIVAFLYFIVTT